MASSGDGRGLTKPRLSAQAQRQPEPTFCCSPPAVSACLPCTAPPGTSPSTHMNRLPFQSPTSSSASGVRTLSMLSAPLLLSRAICVRVQPCGWVRQHEWEAAVRGHAAQRAEFAGVTASRSFAPAIKKPKTVSAVHRHPWCRPGLTWCSQLARQTGGRQRAYKRGSRLATVAAARQCRAYQPISWSAPAVRGPEQVQRRRCWVIRSRVWLACVGTVTEQTEAQRALWGMADPPTCIQRAQQHQRGA